MRSVIPPARSDMTSIMGSMTPYQMVINNVATYIRSPENRDGEDHLMMNAFTASEIIGVGFCKSAEDVIQDLIHAGVTIE